MNLTITDDHRKTKMYQQIKINLTWCQGELTSDADADYHFRYLLRFPENKWFDCTNAATNPLSSELDMINKLSHKGLIESISVPCPDPHNIGGQGFGFFSHSRYLYKLDLSYDYSKYDIVID